jgi:hypothetical protein
MDEAVDNLQALHSNQKLLRSGSVEYYPTIAFMDTIYYASTLLQPMAEGGGRHAKPIGSKNNRNRVRLNRASHGGAGFNPSRRAVPHRRST